VTPLLVYGFTGQKRGFRPTATVITIILFVGVKPVMLTLKTIIDDDGNRRTVLWEEVHTPKLYARILWRVWYSFIKKTLDFLRRIS